MHTSKALLTMVGLAGLAIGASGLVHSPATTPAPVINHGVAQFGPMPMPVHAIFAKGTTPRQMVDGYKKLLGEFGPGLFEFMVGGAGLEFNFTGVRWQPGAFNTPFDLTYSFPPDGIPTGNGGPNALHQIMNNSVGPESVWMGDFETAFNAWAQVAGLSYTQVSDDGAGWPGAPGSSTRGDIRVVAGNFDGPGGVLAFNQFPQNGDMFLDRAENWGVGATDLFLRNVVSHEHGHGIGLSHTCPSNSSKLMEPFINTNFTGPQFDDILAAQFSYGDKREPDNSLGAASALEDLGLQSDTTLTLSTLSLRDPNDGDFFSFQGNGGAVVNMLQALPQGFSYLTGPQNQNGTCSNGTVFNAKNQLDIVLDLLNSTGQVIATSNSGGLGAAEEIDNFTLPADGLYFARVRSTGGAQTSTPIQRYLFRINATLTASVPGDLTGDGAVNGADLAILLTVWGTDGGTSGADLNGDGIVNGADLAALLSAWTG